MQTFYSSFLFLKICSGSPFPADPAPELRSSRPGAHFSDLQVPGLLKNNPLPTNHPDCCKVRITVNHPVPFGIALKYAAECTYTHRHVRRTHTHGSISCLRKHIDRHGARDHLIIRPENVFSNQPVSERCKRAVLRRRPDLINQSRFRHRSVAHAALLADEGGAPLPISLTHYSDK